MAANNTSSKYDSKLDAFFKQFEIPDLWNLHLLENNTVDWSECDAPPVLDEMISVKLYYESKGDDVADKKEYVLLITPQSGIYRHDMRDNTVALLTEYPDKFYCKGAEIAFDVDTGDIYFVGGMEKCFGVYNVERNAWDIKCLNSVDDHDRMQRYELNTVDNQPKVVSHKLYVTGWNAHRYYDAQQDLFIEMESAHGGVEKSPSSNNDTKMVYHAGCAQYIHFGSDSTYTFSYTVDNEIWMFGAAQHDSGGGDGGGSVGCAWKLTDIRLPPVYHRMVLRHVLPFAHIVMLVYFSKDLNAGNGENEVWCLDLRQKQWHQCKAPLPLDEVSSNEDYDVFVGNNGEIHAFVFGSSNNSKHLKMSLSQILDDQLCAMFFAQRFRDLICGFLKECIAALMDTKNDSNVNSALSMIEAYYVRGMHLEQN